jgi:uncharacterized glyoxalase superfamily protein PhnB
MLELHHPVFAKMMRRSDRRIVDNEMTTRPTFGPATPVIPADDVSRSLAFYVDVLGFEEVFRAGDPVGYAGVRRGEATVHLVTCKEPKIAEWTAFRIGVNAIDVLFEHCLAAGVVHPNGALGERPWGSRDFSVIDPSGVCITFWERTED